MARWLARVLIVSTMVIANLVTPFGTTVDSDEVTWGTFDCRVVASVHDGVYVKCPYWT